MRRLFKYSSFVAMGLMMGLILSSNFEWGSVKYAQTVIPESPAPIDQSTVDQFNGMFTNASRKVLPSVVSVASTKIVKQRSYNNPMIDDFFREFFNMPNTPRSPRKLYSLGSGVIVDPKGYVLTNYHVVESADEIKLTLFDEREVDAKIVGKSEIFDIAVLKIDEDDIQPIKMGDSDELKIGEWVLALGSPFSKSLRHTVTQGIVSGVGRIPESGGDRIENYIQTSAAINPGNSGGALVNLKGELIGINTAILSTSRGNQGIGFAIPINQALKVMNDLIDKGHVVQGWLGVGIQNVTDEMAEALGLENKGGVIISRVEPDSPADKGGLEAKDIVVSVNGKKVNNTYELKNSIATRSPGDEIELTVLRGNDEMTKRVKLGELTEENVLSSSRNEETQKIIEKMGISVSNITSQYRARYGISSNERGVVIIDVDPRSIAASFGFREGDVIKEIGDLDIENVKDYENAVNQMEGGKSYLFLIKRNRNAFYVAIKIPEDKD